MAIEKCPLANENCKYWSKPTPGALLGVQEHGCRSDRDHIVPQRLATTVLASAFIYSPDNMQQICRAEHDEKTINGDEPLPDRETMAESVLRQAQMGRVALSKQLSKQIRGEL